jgi:hypothetical protein
MKGVARVCQSREHLEPKEDARGYKLAVETSDIIFDLAQAVMSLASSLAKQLNYMREVAREFPDKIGEVSEATLPAEAKQRLKEALRQ